jgi:hypothetical protein
MRPDQQTTIVAVHWPGGVEIAGSGHAPEAGWVAVVDTVPEAGWARSWLLDDPQLEASYPPDPDAVAVTYWARTDSAERRSVIERLATVPADILDLDAVNHWSALVPLPTSTHQRARRALQLADHYTLDPDEPHPPDESRTHA